MSQAAPQLRNELRDLLRFLLKFAKNPVEAIRSSPDWTWPATVSLQVGISLIAGALSGVLSKSFLNFVAGLFILPLMSLLFAVLISFFIVSFFAFFMSRTLDRRRVFAIVVIANIPHLLMQIFSGFVPPLGLIGFAATCFLLVVGINEHFQIPRPILNRLAFGLFITYFIFWGIYQYQASQQAQRFELAPKALDDLEREVKSFE